MFRILGHKSMYVEPATEEKNVRSKYPELLHADEKIAMAFKSVGELGRDKQLYLTNRRMLIKEGKGIGHNKCRNYLSVPYEKIQAYSVRASGSFVDSVELNVKAKGGFDVTFYFGKNRVSVFALQQFFNDKVFSQISSKEQLFQDKPGVASIALVGSNLCMKNMMDWLDPVQLDDASTIGQAFINKYLKNNAVQLDASTIEQVFTNKYPVLMQDGTEHVQIAFKVGRDTTILTNKRVFIIDVKGWNRTLIKFQTFLWSSISSYAVGTNGRWDRDIIIKLYANIETKRCIYHTGPINEYDLFAVQRTFCDMILREDDVTIPNVDSKEGHVTHMSVGLFSWNHNSPLDAVEMSKVFHTDPNILHPLEVVEMAFKGHRDVFLFTTRRLIVCILRKDLSEKAIEYLSFPWKSIVGFAVRDTTPKLSAKLVIYTDIMHDELPKKDPKIPGKAQMSFDFHNNAIKILDVQMYMSSRIINVEPGASIPANIVLAGRSESGMEDLMSRIRNDQREIDSQKLNRELHTTLPLLLDGEDVVMVHHTYCPLTWTIFTNKRIIIIDSMSLMEGKKSFLSVPFKTIRAFAVESFEVDKDSYSDREDFSRDLTVRIYTRNYWSIANLNFNYSSKTDIIAIQMYLAAMVMENIDDIQQFIDNSYSPIEDVSANMFIPMVDFFLDDTVPDDASLYEQKLRFDLPILLSDEHILHVFRARRDRFIYTNKRLLLIDGHGLKRLQGFGCFSIPNKWISMFSVETAGHMGSKAQIFIHTECSKGVLKQDVAVKKYEIMKLHEFLSKLFFYDGLTQATIE